MCFILVLTRVHERYPLIIAANRDESRTRPTTPPHRWPGEPTIIAGRDDLAGGTWLGVNARGVLAAITNRREEELLSTTDPVEATTTAPESPPPLRGRVREGGDPAAVDGVSPEAAGRPRTPPDPTLPSRGGLCLGALRQDSLGAARAYAESELLRSRWNPFNLLCASANGAWVTNWRGDSWELDPGSHVVTNEGDVDDRGLSMVSRGHELIAALDYTKMPLDALLHALQGICRDTEGPHPICRPGGERGTVSSTLIALAQDGSLTAYWHADGPPCQHAYVPLAVPLVP